MEEMETRELISILSSSDDELVRFDVLDELEDRDLSNEQILKLGMLLDQEDSELCINQFLLLLSDYETIELFQGHSFQEIRWHTNFLWFAACLANKSKNPVYKSVLEVSLNHPVPRISSLARNLLDFLDE